MGEVLFERENNVVESFADKLEPLLPDKPLDPISVDVALPNARLTGALAGVSRNGLLAYRVAKVTANDRVGAWIRHLALNAAAPPGVERITRCIGQDCVLTFSPVDDARERLQELLELYYSGLRRPLHFFPRTACDYSKSWEITSKVRNTWEGSEHAPNPESGDAYYQLAFRGTDPLDSAFEIAARAVFEPLNAALQEERLT